jgi:hypothetical protein
MGHKTIQMKMRYAHLAPAHQLAAVERLVSAPQAALLGSSRAGLPHRVAPMTELQPGALRSEPSATTGATSSADSLAGDPSCFAEVLDKVEVAVNVGA